MVITTIAIETAVLASNTDWTNKASDKSNRAISSRMQATPKVIKKVLDPRCAMNAKDAALAMQIQGVMRTSGSHHAPMPGSLTKEGMTLANQIMTSTGSTGSNTLIVLLAIVHRMTSANILLSKGSVARKLPIASDVLGSKSSLPLLSRFSPRLELSSMAKIAPQTIGNAVIHITKAGMADRISLLSMKLQSPVITTLAIAIIARDVTMDE